MAHEGASVIVADVDGPAAERVAGEFPNGVAAEVDVSDEASVVRMVETAVESFGGVDVLHNNASDASVAAADTDIVDLDMAVFDRLVAVNVQSRRRARDQICGVAVRVARHPLQRGRTRARVDARGRAPPARADRGLVQELSHAEALRT
jgi:NAD(P)-dependent dehydrogenase (short-subunit alcohol dehydrogenase family)